LTKASVQMEGRLVVLHFKVQHYRTVSNAAQPR
jgi:hypothetical protein